MKAINHLKYFALYFFLHTAITNAQTTFSNDEAIDYIIQYYANFQTGFDSDGYNIVTNNYKATFNDRDFMLTYDVYDTQSAEKRETRSVSFNIKDIESIAPMGMKDAVIYGDETIYIPLNAKLLFQSGSNEYYLNIYYEVDDDVEKSRIYIAFETIWKYHQKEE